MKPSATSARNWWSGEFIRVGSRSRARREASPSKYVPSSSRIWPIALSRFDSSNRSVTNAWRRPRSPRNASRVRGSRPSPSAKFWRRSSLERGRGPLVGLGGPAEEPVELASDGVDVDRDAGVLERDEADPEGALDERGPVVRRPLGDEPGQPGIDQDEPLDDDPLTVEPDDGPGRAVAGPVRPGDNPVRPADPPTAGAASSPSSGENWMRVPFFMPRS